MKLINGNIDHLFREKLSDYKANAPERVWERIEGDLTGAKKRKLMPVWLRVAAAVVLLIGVGGLIIKFSGKPTVHEQITEEIIAQPAVKQTETENIASNNIVSDKPDVQIATVLKDESSEITTQNNEVHDLVASQDYIAVKEAVDKTAEDKIALAASSSFEPSIDNTYIRYESDVEIQNGVKTKAIPVYQATHVNSYYPVYAEESSTKKKSTKWSLGGQAGPQYSYRDLVIDDPASQNINLDEYESGMVTYAGGVNVQMGTNSRFSFQSGVYYSKIGTSKAEVLYSNPDNTYSRAEDTWVENTPTEIANSTGSFSFDKSYSPQQEPPPSEIEASSYVKGEDVVQEYFEYIEIPLIVRYKIIDRKLGVDLNGGIWTNFLIDIDATSTSQESLVITEQPENINKVNYSGSLGIGLDYPITSNLLFNLEPVFKYYLSPINNIGQTKVHPYTFGIMTGIRYSF